MSGQGSAPASLESVDAPAIEGSLRSPRDFPYWLVAIVAILLWMGYLIATESRYNIAYTRIIDGIGTTIRITILGFLFALGLGLLAGLGRISRNIVLRNLATFYIEFIRGVPMLVLILMVAFVIVPRLANTFGLQNDAITKDTRMIIALSLIYGAYLGEVFRAGIESVPKGQMEAGRSVGMSHTQTMSRIILPQAVRNMIPAIGNDAIAMLKDSSLASVLAVREITQQARLHVGTSFDADSTYLVLTLLYLTMTLSLSLVLSWYRRRLGLDDRG